MFQYIKKLTRFLKPGDSWKIPVIILSGIFTGLIFYILYISRASSYLSDNPGTCVNCHVMSSQYASWSRSSTRMATNCNDCHVPHTNIFSHYFFKAKDGLRHSRIFTLRKEPQVIMIRRPGQNVVQGNCIRCHSYRLANISNRLTDLKAHDQGNGKFCWECHRSTPHMCTNSLSGAPGSIVPLPQSPVPAWLNRLLK